MNRFKEVENGLELRSEWGPEMERVGASQTLTTNRNGVMAYGPQIGSDPISQWQYYLIVFYTIQYDFCLKAKENKEAKKHKEIIAVGIEVDRLVVDTGQENAGWLGFSSRALSFLHVHYIMIRLTDTEK